MRDTLLVGAFAIVFAAPAAAGSIAIDSVEHSASAVIFGNAPAEDTSTALGEVSLTAANADPGAANAALDGFVSPDSLTASLRADVDVDAVEPPDAPTGLTHTGLVTSQIRFTFDEAGVVEFSGSAGPFQSLESGDGFPILSASGSLFILDDEGETEFALQFDDPDGLTFDGSAALGPGSFVLEVRTTVGAIDGFADSNFFDVDIALVPAPAAAALLGLGGLAMTRRRR